MRTNAFRELFFFGLVGGTGAIIYWALNLYLTGLGVPPSISIAISLILLIPPVYYLQHRLTFRAADRRHRTAFPRYVGAQLFGNVVAMVLTEVFDGIIKDHAAVAWFVITLGVAAMNWVILKFWAFRAAPHARRGVRSGARSAT